MTPTINNKKQRVATIIVTYNRYHDLKKAITAQLLQTRKPDHIVVINNNSSDQTEAYLQTIRNNATTKFTAINLSTNTGGAGGFHFGLKEALKLDIERFWLLDDDGAVRNDALEQLIIASNDDRKTYTSTAICHEDHNKLCWPPSRAKLYVSNLDEIESFNFAPFLGFYIHRDLVEKIGLPNREYFISGDDYEYSLRLQAVGEKIHWVKKSKIYHPQPNRIEASILGLKLRHLRLDPWRRFYDTRNRIWTARQHKGKFRVALTIISILIHLIISLVVEKRKIENLKSLVKGIKNGLLTQSKQEMEN